ncbi:MAG: efflux RND transporter periplasmic adaptor subunit [Thermoanaerobaculaceae bacterium]|nr:efflux RND transporter periplasmic adaptor subunit [Thermoanaerobaculaceae bacterium]
MRVARGGVIVGVAAAACAAVVSLGCREVLAAGPPPHAPAGTVAPGEAILSAGRVAFDDDLVAHVGSPVAGTVVRVLAKLGARVNRGAPLAVIASPELAHVVPDTLQAEADLAAAEGEYQRQRQLFDAHEGVTEHLEAARAGLATARVRAERARARAALVKSLGADEMAGSFTVVAPRAGVVLASTAAPGAPVAGPDANGGEGSLFTVGSLDRVWVIARIPGRDAASVELGARVTVRSAAPRRTTSVGRVAGVSPPGPDLREATVRCAVANPGWRLRPGAAVTVAIAAPAHAAR